MKIVSSGSGLRTRKEEALPPYFKSSCTVGIAYLLTKIYFVTGTHCTDIPDTSVIAPDSNLVLRTWQGPIALGEVN